MKTTEMAYLLVTGEKQYVKSHVFQRQCDSIVHSEKVSYCNRMEDGKKKGNRRT